MSHKIIKFGMLALVALALTYCQREDAPEAPQQDPVPAVDPQAVVSLNEAKSLFEASENQKRTANSVSRRKYPFIELETDWRYFEQTQTLVGDAYSKIPVTIVGSDLSAEMLFLKEDGVTEPYLFITEPDSLTNDNRIVNADFYLFTPKGEFISAYRMTDGVISHQLVPKVKANYRLVVDAEAAQAGRKKRDFDISILSVYYDCCTEIRPDSGGDCDCNGGEPEENPFQLEEVTVYGKRKKRINNSYTPYPSYTPYKPNNNGFPIKEGGRGSSNVGAGLAIDGDNTAEEEKEDTIKDSLTNRCAKALLAQAPNLNNDIAKILRETFGTNNKYNLTFLEDNALRGTSVDAYCRPTSVSDKDAEINIFLNPDVLNSATKEYVLVTIYHEAIHAFLSCERERLGEKFQERYPNIRYRTAMGFGNGVAYDKFEFIDDKHLNFAPFIDRLVDAIHSFNPNIPLNTAKAMAKTGIVKNVFDWEVKLNQNEREGNNDRKGTKCTP